MAGIPPTTLYLWGCRKSCRVHKTKTPAPTARHSCFIPLCQISSRNSCRNSAAHWTLSKTSYAVPHSAGPHTKITTNPQHVCLNFGRVQILILPEKLKKWPGYRPIFYTFGVRKSGSEYRQKNIAPKYNNSNTNGDRFALHFILSGVGKRVEYRQKSLTPK